MITIIKDRLSLLAVTAMMAVSLVAPQKVHADAATATALGGAALFASMTHAATPMGTPVAVPAFPQASVAPPAVVTPSVGLMVPGLSPIHQPTVYSSVSPTAAPAPEIKAMQQVSFAVTAPTMPPLNMPSYSTGPLPALQPAMPQQPGVPQAVAPQPARMAMPETGMPGQGYPMVPQQALSLPQQGMMWPQQSLTLPQQGMSLPQTVSFSQPGLNMQTVSPPQQGMSLPQAVSVPQQGMSLPQTVSVPQQGMSLPQQTAMMSQGGYGASMPNTSFAYAR
ncbi:MAG: hypothetical protein HQL73_05635 [Magnetococcales bacterium]|nr:hypothetical protein [Magnetococcales bacterium]